MQVRVVVEMAVQRGQDADQNFAAARRTSDQAPNFELDTEYPPVPVRTPPSLAAAFASADQEAVIVRGTIEEDEIPSLEALPEVVKVWREGRIAPFSESVSLDLIPAAGFGDCPFADCDCSPSVPKGNIQAVATHLGVNQIWAEGFRGQDMVIGIVDGGITAQGRPIAAADQNHVGNVNCRPNGLGQPSWPMAQVPNVIGGWPGNTWGTTGVAWCWHGNMTSTDALGMAPDAQIYDIRISDAPDIEGTLSDALAGFDWAIRRHRQDGTPHVLSNSWGIYQEDWDADYATDPDHFFTRKVEEAIEEGILVLFAAGNCGERCPDGRCGSDIGPQRSIWGANGHPQVMTVGAVNLNEEYIGYSGQGPAALDPEKPDFCAISHFTGYFNSDTGTSAACPVAAGVVALLKQAHPTLTQQAMKQILSATAKDLGDPGWDPHTGHGLIQAKTAFDNVDIGNLLAVEGKPTFLRVHDVGTGWGPASDFLDAEVVIKLDTVPDRAFGFQLRNDVRKNEHHGMLDVVRDAFNRNQRIRIEYVRTGLRNGRVIRVSK